MPIHKNPPRLLLALAVILCLLMPAAAWCYETQLPHYDLTVRINPEEGILTGKLKLTVHEAGQPVDVAGLSVKEASFEGRPIAVNKDNMIIAPHPGQLVVTYAILINSASAAGAEDDPENSGIVPEVSINSEGVYLMSRWYPKAAGLGIYKLSTYMPKGMEAVSEADSIESREVGGMVEHSFTFPYPTEHITLSAARYEVTRALRGATEVYVYMLADSADKDLAAKYLDKTGDYLQMYEALLGPYPYKRMSVVENALPSGYSMPTYTLIGKTIMRLPFILDTSLGHEVLHQWFGCGVFMDLAGGNWSEGLTSYLADHRYDELKGEGAAHRKKLLLDYRNFVNSTNEIALKDFTGRSDYATRAIGYGKAAMVFHMLRQEVGQEAFEASLRAFVKNNMHRNASWGDLRVAFETNSRQTDLSWFFEQWIKRKGQPELNIKDVRVLVLGGKNIVRFDITQRGPEYKYTLPVGIELQGGRVIQASVRMEGREKRVELPLGADEEPTHLILDAGYDLMRPLGPMEAPPVIATLLGAQKRLVIAPSEEKASAIYQPALDYLRARGFEISNAASAKNDDVRDASVMVMGAGHELIKRLTARDLAEGFPLKAEAAVKVYRNPLSDERGFAVLNATSPEAASSAVRKMFRYGKYSTVSFGPGGSVADKAMPEAEAGLILGLMPRTVGYRVREALGLTQIIKESLAKSDIVFVGEAHTNYEHHKIQLRFIEAMRSGGQKFAIGMEMFDRNFQQALEDYVSKKIDETEFLRKSDYFNRWSYNYHHYREILDYARTYGIPVVALNQPSEVIGKVSRGGLDALGAEDKKSVPADMDLSEEGYRQRLKDIFFRHEGGQARRFEYFYEAQVLWDETMAHSVAEYLQKNPGQRMVVITGQGHTMFRSGIPKRVERLTGKRGVVVIHSDDGVYDPEVADYVLFAEPMEEPAMPAIGIKAGGRGPQGKGMVVAGVQEGGPAGRAGLKDGDVIVRADGAEVNNVGDLKAALALKAPGDAIELRVIRKRFILSDEELTIRVILP